MRRLWMEARFRRLARRAAGWEHGFSGPFQRAAAWADMLVLDHGFLRLAYLNRHRVSPDLWRSAQPAPRDLRQLAASGIRTVVTLRAGRAFGSWPLEREACQRLGLSLAHFSLRAREAPGRELILSARDFFAGLEYPALIHCKSGADRTGFMAALYLLGQGRPLDEAMAQLSLRYGHFRFTRSGVLGRVFELYRQDGAPRGLGFFEWVERDYDPEILARSPDRRSRTGLGALLGSR